MVILEETLDPPKIAVTGFSQLLMTLSIAKISLANKAPKQHDPLKNCVIIVVEACALCAVPKASLI